MISRHMQRQYAVQTLYAFIMQERKYISLDDFMWISNVALRDISYAIALYKAAFKNLKSIDVLWHREAGRHKNIIYECDACILRVAIAELCYMGKPLDFAIIAKEYVQIAKVFSSDNTYKFINGVLNAVYNSYNVRQVQEW